MKIFKYIELLNRLHLLVTEKQTGNASELAEELHISLKQVHSLLQEMKHIGASIGYSEKKRSYYYTVPFEFDISINYGELKPFELRIIRGGSLLGASSLYKYFFLS